MWGISILLVPKSIHDSMEETGPAERRQEPPGQHKARRAIPSLPWDQGGMFAPAAPVPEKRGDSVSVTINQALFTRAKNALAEGKQNKNTKQRGEKFLDISVLQFPRAGREVRAPRVCQANTFTPSAALGTLPLECQIYI